MISVYISDDGGLAYRCSVCDFTEAVSGQFLGHVFWIEYNGQAILQMIEHYRIFHDSRSIHPGKENPDATG